MAGLPCTKLLFFCRTIEKLSDTQKNCFMSQSIVVPFFETTEETHFSNSSEQIL